MKGLAFVVIIMGILAVWYLSQQATRETFVPEFLDQSNVRRTAETSSSSYEQRTNHFVPTRPQEEPIPGVETPFRVNMYNSYMI